MAKTPATQNNEENNSPDNKIDWTKILDRLFYLLGAVIVALIGYFGVRTQIYAPVGITQTAQAIYATQTAEALFVAAPALPQTQPPALTTTATFTLSPSPSPLPTTTATPTNTPVPKVLLMRPEEDHLYSFPVIFYDYLNSIKPITRTYRRTIQSDETYMWKYFWCAKYEGSLQENLGELDFVFMVDDVIMPEEYFQKYRTHGGAGASNENWVCQAWATILTQWAQDETVILSVFYDISRPLSDGENTYQLGDYRHDIIVSVE